MIKAFFTMWWESFLRRGHLHVLVWKGVRVDPAPGMLWELYVLVACVAVLLTALIAYLSAR